MKSHGWNFIKKQDFENTFLRNTCLWKQLC